MCFYQIKSNHLFPQQVRNKHCLTGYKNGEPDSKAHDKKH